MRLCFAAGLGVLFISTAGLFAGGSGLNVVVIVNQSSTNSVQLGNYYCEWRGVPPQNLLRINWAGGNTSWNRSDFETCLLNPLVSMLSSRGLTNQADYVVLSMDIPYQVTDTNGVNSTTAALFYGFKTDDCAGNCPEGIPGCNLPAASYNAYAGSEGVFRQTPPVAAGSNAWLVTMLTSSNLAQAEAIIDRGVASDGMVPTQTVWLAKSSDTARNVRYLEFDSAIYDARVAGDFSVLRTNSDSPYGLTNLLGYQTGLYRFNILSNAFVPGAMADNLTSYGGLILVPNDHTTLLAFLNAGACGSYGTVTEPCNYLQKFPSPEDYFYQARGFSLAECYYLSLANPYQGLIVGEPLAAPFAKPGAGTWNNLSAGATLAGTTNLSFQFAASDAGRPLQQVDLFLDGVWAQTITNIPPQSGNVLAVFLNGQTINYTVPSDATVSSVAAGLATELNEPANTNATKVTASAHGDRIELRCADPSQRGSQIPLSAGTSIGGGAALTTFLAATGTNLLDTIAFGIRNYYVTNAPNAGDYLQLSITKTNGTMVVVSVTNNGGLNIGQLVQQLVSAVNSNAGLSTPDGLGAQDFIDYTPHGLQLAEFNLQANTCGWNEAQIQVTFSGSSTFTFTPAGANVLDGNLPDLQPRAHLYVTAGTTNLALSFPFDSTSQPDGFHTLDAVACEGSHVRTQTRATQSVRIQNTPLGATFTTLAGASNTVLNFTLLFSVAANTNTISSIELFSTGGSVGVVSNLSSATFAVAATNLGVGLHPFYAVVTRSDGKTYRTETRWICIGASELPFSLTMTAPPPAIFWPATAGQLYQVLSASNITDTFQLRDTITPSNAAGLWIDTITGAPQQFYRIYAPQ